MSTMFLRSFVPSFNRANPVPSRSLARRYGHDIDATGLGGLALVMAGVLYRVKMKAGDKQLLLFEGINEGQGKVMVREWREHLEL